MPRQSYHLISVLNVTIHPHEPSRYVEMFSLAIAKRIGVKLRGDAEGMVGSGFYVDEQNPLAGMQGDISRYTVISRDKPWFNKDRKEAATDLELGKVNIPAELTPNLKTTRYIFDPVSHKVFWFTKLGNTHFPAKTVQMIFERTLNQPEVVEKFGKVNVHIEQEKSTLEKAFELPSIEKIIIDYTKPNGDSGDGHFEAFRKEVEVQHVGKFHLELSADERHNIIPNDRTKAMAEVARSNGYTKVTAKDAEGRITEINTEDHPVKIPVREPAKTFQPITWLIQNIKALVERIKKENP